MIKKFMLKQALKLQGKNMPDDQRQMLETLIEENPDLMMKIGKEIKAQTKAGKPQHAAMMEVMKRHQNELRKALGQ